MSKFLSRLPVRISILVATSFVLAISLTLTMQSHATRHSYEEREEALDMIVDIAIRQLDEIQLLVDEGAMDLNAAKSLGRQRLHSLQFGDDGYYFGVDLDYISQVSPRKSDLIGQNMKDHEDVTGFKTFQAIVDTAKEQGSGIVRYSYQVPGSDQIQPKMSFVRLYEPWGWVIGTGIYLADIESELAAMRWKALGFMALGLTLLGAVAVFITRSITVPVGRLKTRMEDMANDDLDTPVPGTSSQSEIGEMAQKVDVFRQSLIRQRGLEQEQKTKEDEQLRVVESLRKHLEKLSKGDLKTQIEQEFPDSYEGLRSDFNTTVSNLNATVTEVISAASSIRNGVGDINQSSADLSRRTESQAATLEQTAAALEQLTASVKSATSGAQNAEQVTREARDEAEESGMVVRDAVSAMTEIESSSEKISQILGVIDDIAFQTNLLALNAGVEAARAGEAGRGFAVVASEVRGLAQRSSDQALEIKNLIEESSKQVENGVQLVGRAGDALTSIVGRVNQISRLVSEIAESSAEQSTGLGEINTGMSQLDEVTQRNAAMAEQSNASAQQLDDEAAQMGKLVEHFSVNADASIPAETPEPHVAAEPAENSNTSLWDVPSHTPSDTSDPTPVQKSTGSINKSQNAVWQDF